MIITGVVQIRESSTGTYPSLVYQPLRSPKSPYAKFGPGSSCTLPAKLGARLMNQSLVYNNNRLKSKRLLNDSNVIKEGCLSVYNNDEIIEDQLTTHNDDISGINKNISEEATSLLPRFLHHSSSSTQLIQPPKHSASCCIVNKTNNNDNLLELDDIQHSILTDDINSDVIGNNNHLNYTQQQQHQHQQLNDLQQIHHNHQQITATDKSDNKNQHCKHVHHQAGVDRTIRSSSEENSNASSDHSNGGYFSEDSSQSITDLYGSPLELKVRIRQCSDEKLLKKNLSKDNLLQADYISRPNEKCKC